MNVSMVADLVILLDRERIEVERLKGVVNRLHDALGRQQGEINRLQFAKDYFENEAKKFRSSVPQTASEVYAAQNELELLRTIRKSQGEAITKLRRERDTALEKLKHSDSALVHVRVERNEAYAERDAASKRANGWRDVAQTSQETLLQARSAIQSLLKERDEMYREMDGLRKDLKVSQAVNHIISRREQHNPRLEIILEESYRNEFKRNIDNQKATDGVSPNCPSS